MTDKALVERLRAASKGFVQQTPRGYYGLCAEAADTIESQASLLNMMREALERISNFRPVAGKGGIGRSTQIALFAQTTAREALATLKSQVGNE